MKRSRTNPSEMKAHRERVKLAKEQQSAKPAGQAPDGGADTDEGRAVLLAAKPIGRLGDGDYEYELPDDDDGPMVTHRIARLALMAGRIEPTAREEGSADGECGKCREAQDLTVADQQAVVEHGMLPKLAHEHCHQCDAVA